MKVLLFNGSPRANGCTFAALSEIARVLEEEGVGAEILQIGRGPCRTASHAAVARRRAGASFPTTP